MALSAESMAAKIIQHLDELDYTLDHTYDSSVRYQIWLKICAGIVEEITQNARAVGTDSDGDSHDLNIV